MRMKRLIVIVIITVGFVSLDMSNPRSEDFTSYVERQIERAKNTRNDSFYEFFVGLSDEAKTTIMEQGVRRRDYLFFSIFEVLDPESKSAHRVLGVAKKIFIPLNEHPNRGTSSIY